jgi:MFS transporter, DHA3 family, macrolide efflux protein
VFAMRGAVVMAALPLAYALAGPLADYVFKPLATSGGTFFGSAVRSVGDGSGRGLALMLVTLGGLYVLLAVVGSLNRHLRGLEAELPELIAARQRKAEAQTRALPYGPPVEPAAE